MPAYYIAEMKIVDADLYRQVQQRFASVFAKYSGRVLAADPDFQVLDGNVDCDRIIVIEFPSAKELRAWYKSPEYQESIEMRRRAARANIVLVHGLAE